MTERVLVFGEALVDAFPGAVVPGGAPFNVARHLAAFGLDPLMLTRLGKDPDADILIAEMARFGMTMDALQEDQQRATGRVQISESSFGQHIFIIEKESAYDHIDFKEFEATPDSKQSYDWIYSGTLALRNVNSRRTYYSLQEKVSAKCFLDFNWRNNQIDESHAWQAFIGADTVKLNDSELHLLLAWRGLQQTQKMGLPNIGAVYSELTELLISTKITLLVVTYGEQGYAAFDKNGICLASGAGCQNILLIDSVGAGDAFSAITILGLINAWPLDVTLARANQFAGEICGLRGAVPSQLDFYNSWKIDWQIPSSQK